MIKVVGGNASSPSRRIKPGVRLAIARNTGRPAGYRLQVINHAARAIPDLMSGLGQAVAQADILLSVVKGRTEPIELFEPPPPDEQASPRHRRHGSTSVHRGM